MSLQGYANLNLIQPTSLPEPQPIPNNIQVSNIINNIGQNQGIQGQDISVQDLIRAAGGDPNKLYQQKAPMSSAWNPVNTGIAPLDWTANLIPNALHDLPEIGTGIVHSLTHAPEIGQQINDWLKSDRSIGGRIGDVYDVVWGDALGLTHRDIENTISGKQSIGDTIGNIGKQIGENPLFFLGGLSMTPAAGAVGKVAKIAQSTRLGKAIQAVSDISAVESRKIASKIINNEENMRKVIKKGKYTSNDIAETVRYMESGDAGAIPEQLKPLSEALRETYKTLDESGLVPEYTRMPYRDMSIVQAFTRDNGGYFADWRRDLTPLFERMYEGIDNVPDNISEAISKGEALNKINKGLKKSFKDVTDETLFNNLSDEAKDLFRKYLSEDEIGIFTQEGSKVGEIKNYLNDNSIDATIAKKKIFNPNNLSESQKIRLKENLEKMSMDAANGDAVMQKFLAANKQFDEGNLFPVSHGLAPVIKSAGEVAANDRKFAGRFSERAYGNASYEDIAQQVLNPQEFYNNAIKGFVKDKVSENLLRGEISEGVPLTDSASTKIKYLNRVTLEEGKLETAIKEASDTPSTFGDNAIPIDRLYLKALKDQFGENGQAWYSGGLQDLANLWKETALVSGGYLGGNALSGAFNTLINSNINTIGDVINAIGTKGKIIKELGVWRDPLSQRAKFNTGWAKTINKINKPFGGKWINWADATLQNFWAETAAHAKLREMGVAPKERISSLNKMTNKKLAEAINDIRLVSFAQLDKTIIPKELQGALGTVQPFWRWLDTATQSSLYMLAKHPALSQMALVNMLGRIGFDKEMQNRLNLRVKSDKPLVSYRFDSKTGQIKELSADYLPQMTTLKVLVEPKSLIRNGMPVVGLLMNTAQGKDAYGKPLNRSAKNMFDQIAINGNRRYRINPETGYPEPFDIQGDEVIATMLKSIFTLPNLANKTLLPLATSAINTATGSDLQYYQPYAQSIMGSYSTGQPEQGFRTFLSSGNPLKPRGAEEVGKSLSNIYEMNYYPDEPIASQIQKINRNRMYRYGRNLRGY